MKKRKVMTIVFSLLIPFSLLAQTDNCMRKSNTHEPLLSADKTWIMCYKPVGPMYEGQNSYDELMLGNERIIDGITFRQILRRPWWIEDGQYPSSDWQETGNYIGQDSKGKVYYYGESMDKYIVVMDFSLKVGDTYIQMDIDGNISDEFIVTNVSEEIFSNISDNMPRKCIYLTSIHNSPMSDVWIDGIGSVTGGFEGAMIFLFAGSAPSLYQCKENGIVIYENTQSTTDISQHRANTIIYNNMMYNLQGRRLDSRPTTKGVVIRDGRKVVLK